MTAAAVAGWCMQMEDVRHIDEQMVCASAQHFVSGGGEARTLETRS